MSKFREWVRKLPQRKQYIEVISAVLTIPVLVTVIILNVLSLRNKDKAAEPGPTPKETRTIIVLPSSEVKEKEANEVNPTNAPTPTIAPSATPVPTSTPSPTPTPTGTE